MTATYQTENRNFGWQAVEYGRAFTPATPPEFIHESKPIFQSPSVPFARSYEAEEEVHLLEADQDIAAGRIRMFSSAKAMLKSLKKKLR